MLSLMLALTQAVAAAAGAAKTGPPSAPAEAAGWIPRALLIANAGSHRLTCRAELAHWFSHDFAALEANRTVRLALWFDPKTGTHALRGARGEPVPIEALWCGLGGCAYRTRALIPLDPDRTARVFAASVACRAEGEKVFCAPE